jgi:hypothetical protein
MDLSDLPPPKGHITSGFLSKHVGAERRFNENNYGLGYLSPEGWGMGVYKNSLGKPSGYVAREFSTNPVEIGPAQVAGTLNLGGVVGYPKPILPVVMPGLNVGLGDYTVAAGLVPRIKGVTPLTIALQLRKQMK